MPDNHPLKRTDRLRLDERLLRERKARTEAERISFAEQARLRRKELWDALSSFIRSQGNAWIVSTPGTSNIRIEVRRGFGGSLAAKLANYNPRLVSTATRAEGGFFIPVEIIELVV